MDLGQLVISALVAAVVGGGFAEWRTRAAEARAQARELAAEKRAEERDRKHLERDDWLRSLDDTQADVNEVYNFHLARSAGDVASQQEAGRRRGELSRAQLYLIADEEVIRRYIDVCDELESHATGAKDIGMDTIARMGAVQGLIKTRLDIQRARLRAGEDPLWPSAAFVRELVNRLGDKHEIAPEFRPQIREA